MTTALDYRKQVQLNKPAKAFRKARKVYGNRMEDAPRKAGKGKEVTTDFKALIAMQIERSEKRQKAYNRFIGLLGLAIIAFLFFYFNYIFGLTYFFF